MARVKVEFGYTTNFLSDHFDKERIEVYIRKGLVKRFEDKFKVTKDLLYNEYFNKKGVIQGITYVLPMELKKEVRKFIKEDKKNG